MQSIDDLLQLRLVGLGNCYRCGWRCPLIRCLGKGTPQVEAEVRPHHLACKPFACRCQGPTANYLKRIEQIDGNFNKDWPRGAFLRDAERIL